MATHSSILAWEIPWTEEPGGLYCKFLGRVGYDLVTKQQQRNRKEMLNVTEEVSISIELILEKNNRSTN